MSLRRGLLLCIFSLAVFAIALYFGSPPPRSLTRCGESSTISAWPAFWALARQFRGVCTSQRVAALSANAEC